MRIFFGVVFAASLLANGAWGESLSPGHPAGVREARMTAGKTALMLGAGALVMIAGGILISGSSPVIDALQIKSQGITVAPPVSPVISISSSTGTP